MIAITHTSLTIRAFGRVLVLMRSQEYDSPRCYHNSGGGHLRAAWGAYLLLLLPVPHASQSRLTRTLRRWPHALRRALLWLTPWPVYMWHSAYCCDTGPFGYAVCYPHGRAAWHGTTDEALFAGSDGPAHCYRITRTEYRMEGDR